jgi:hypothetical protein
VLPARPQVGGCGGYGTALRDWNLVGLALVSLALVSVGIAPMLVLMPTTRNCTAKWPPDDGPDLRGRHRRRAPAQLPITRLGKERRPMPYLALGIGLWLVARAVSSWPPRRCDLGRALLVCSSAYYE